MTEFEATGLLSDARVVQPLYEELTATAGNSFLSVWIHSEDGKGSWNQITEQTDQAAPWSMCAQGIVALDRKMLNLEAAAEAFAMKLLS